MSDGGDAVQREDERIPVINIYTENRQKPFQMCGYVFVKRIIKESIGSKRVQLSFRGCALNFQSLTMIQSERNGCEESLLFANLFVCLFT